jgi:hypothetical protein
MSGLRIWSSDLSTWRCFVRNIPHSVNCGELRSHDDHEIGPLQYVSLWSQSTRGALRRYVVGAD